MIQGILSKGMLPSLKAKFWKICINFINFRCNTHVKLVSKILFQPPKYPTSTNIFHSQIHKQSTQTNLEKVQGHSFPQLHSETLFVPLLRNLFFVAFWVRLMIVWIFYANDFWVYLVLEHSLSQVVVEGFVILSSSFLPFHLKDPKIEGYLELHVQETREGKEVETAQEKGEASVVLGKIGMGLKKKGRKRKERKEKGIITDKSFKTLLEILRGLEVKKKKIE